MRRLGCCRSGRFLFSSIILLPCHALENLTFVLRFGHCDEQVADGSHCLVDSSGLLAALPRRR